MSKTVYAVSEGCYSDYSVTAIFTTRARAQAFIDSFDGHQDHGDFNNIEEYTLDEAAAELGRGYRKYRVVMSKSGKVSETSRAGTHGCITAGQPVTWMDQMYGKKVEPWTNFYVWAKDDMHAVKIANEQRIAALAAP